MPWVNSPHLSMRPERPREPELDRADRQEALAAFQAAFGVSPFPPGHRPAASALGSALPARWAGGDYRRRERFHRLHRTFGLRVQGRRRPQESGVLAFWESVCPFPPQKREPDRLREKARGRTHALRPISFHLPPLRENPRPREVEPGARAWCWRVVRRVVPGTSIPRLPRQQERGREDPGSGQEDAAAQGVLGPHPPAPSPGPPSPPAPGEGETCKMPGTLAEGGNDGIAPRGSPRAEVAGSGGLGAAAGGDRLR
jgi:hypothetical protein